MRLVSIDGEREIPVSHRLTAPLAVLIGPNATGKTTALQLLEFALDGPGRDRRPTNTRARLRFDSGLVIERSVVYETDEKGRPKSDHQPLVLEPGGGVSRKVGECAAVIQQYVGSTWSWRVADVLASTATERRKALARLVVSGVTKKILGEALRAADAGVAAMPEEVRKHIGPEIKAFALVPEEEGERLADEYLAAVRKAKNAIQADVETARAAVATADERAKAAGASPGALHAWEEAVATARARLAALAADLATAKANAKTRETVEKTVAAARTAYDKAKTTAEADLRSVDYDVESTHTSFTTAQKAHAQAATANAEAAATSTAILAEERAASDALRAAQEEASALATRIDAANLLRDLLVPVLASREFAYLHGISAEEFKAEEDAFHAARNQLLALLETNLAVDEARPVAEARAALAGVRARMDAAERVAGRLRAAEAAAARELTQRTEAHSRALEAQRVAREAKARAAATLPELAAALKAAEESAASIGQADTAAIELQLEAANTEVREAEARLKTIRDYEAITADKERCATNAGLYAKARNDLHELEKRAEKVVAELYAKAMQPLMGPASEITGAVFGGSLTIDPLNDWSIGLGDLPIEHCSESQAMVVGIALHAARQRLAHQGWRAALIDGIELIDRTRRDALVAALADFGLDNVIVTCVADGWTPDISDGRACLLRTSESAADAPDETDTDTDTDDLWSAS